MTIGYGANLSLMVSGNQGEQHYTQFMAFLRGIDGLVQPHAKSLTTTAPPASPADGDVYIVPSGATGAWSGKTNQVTRWSGAMSAWEFYAPHNGWRLYVEDKQSDYSYNGTSWIFATPGSTWLTGSGAPASGTGTVGNFYIDTATGNYYQKTGPTTWTPVANLTGPQGNSINRPTASISSSGGVVTIDLSTGDEVYLLTLTENVTSWAFPTLPASGKTAEIVVEITQGASTAYTCVSPASTGRTAGSYPWSVSSTLGAVERLGLSIDHAGVVSLFAAGVFG